MIVEHILARKGHDIITTQPERTLAETARLLDEQRIGAVLVSDADHPVLGIISERDIARAVARRGAAALDEPVSKHMTAKVITCTRRSSVSDLMELMTDRRVRHVPVVEGGRVFGIISIGDIVKNRLTELESEQDAIREYATGATNPGQRF
jgi:signal-transduction protein with cAMP-binding, CBS, and nucleotidyltransferase domain